MHKAVMPRGTGTFGRCGAFRISCSGVAMVKHVADRLTA